MTIKLSNSKKVKNFPENVVSRYNNKFKIFYARNLNNKQKEKYYNREKKYRQRIRPLLNLCMYFHLDRKIIKHRSSMFNSWARQISFTESVNKLRKMLQNAVHAKDFSLD